MTGYPYTIKKSSISVEGLYSRPAFVLFRPESNLHETISVSLSEFYLIQSDDIRINQDVNPLANANVTYHLTPLDGLARVFVDRAQLFLFSPQILTTDQITDLSSAFFNGVHQEIGEISFGSFIINSAFHAKIEGVSPEEFIAAHVSSEKKVFDSIIGHSVTYYLGQEEQRSYSSVTLDISNESSEYVFVRVELRYDGDKVQLSDLPDLAIRHYSQLLSFIDLEFTQ